MSTAAAPGLPHRAAWRVAQGAGLALLAALVAGLILAPPLALDLLWNAAVPVLPATFLLSTTIWRNVCPLATLSLLRGARAGRRTMDGAAVQFTAVVGVALFLLLVPARRFAFNTDGPALAVTIVLVGGLAFATGLRHLRKAGFCNAICPVHPIERLYGQRPLLDVTNVRCVPCLNCTTRGCLDRSPTDSLRTVLGHRGPHTASRWWLVSPFGLFAAALPGFIVGFYTIGNVALAEALDVYRHVAGTMLVSAALIVLATGLLRLAPQVVMPLLAGLATTLYYWYAAPVIVTAWDVEPWLVWLIRTIAFLLVGGWLLRALRAPDTRLSAVAR